MPKMVGETNNIAFLFKNHTIRLKLAARYLDLLIFHLLIELSLCRSLIAVSYPFLSIKAVGLMLLYQGGNYFYRITSPKEYPGAGLQLPALCQAKCR
jgi:hypothetical protein